MLPNAPPAAIPNPPILPIPNPPILSVAPNPPPIPPALLAPPTPNIPFAIQPPQPIISNRLCRRMFSEAQRASDVPLPDQDEDPFDPPPVRRSIRWQNPKFHDMDFPSRTAFIAQVADPVSVKDALTGVEADKWRAAMDAEMQSLHANKTWILVNRPSHKRPITCKWILRRKYNADGSISRYKARLVASGFSQIPGVDYTETFSPIVKITSLRILIALAAHFHLHLHQMDVQTAFLHGNLQDQYLFMEQPPHYITPGQEHLVCKLLKSLYGLKQSSRVWYQRFSKFLQTLGYQRLISDSSVYHRNSQRHLLILGLYVDDLLLVSSDLNYLQTCKDELTREFQMFDHGPAQFCLGIHIHRHPKSGDIFISQTKYIADMLHHFQMVESTPLTIPMPAGSRLLSADAPNTMADKNFMAQILYRQAAGCI